MEFKPLECLSVESFLWIVNKGSALVASARILFFLLSLMHKPASTGRVSFSIWISAWLAVARWNVWRADRLRLHIGLSARFISFLGLPENPLNYVHLLVNNMKGMSCTAEYWHAELTWTTPSVLHINIWWTPDMAMQGQAKPFPAPVCSHLLCGWWCKDIPLTWAAAEPGSNASGKKDR